MNLRYKCTYTKHTKANKIKKLLTIIYLTHLAHTYTELAFTFISTNFCLQTLQITVTSFCVDITLRLI
jgi:hypothetical protein